MNVILFFYALVYLCFSLFSFLLEHLKKGLILMSKWTDYLDFSGSILSGLIGGLMTYYGVKLTLDRTQKDKQEQDNRTSIKDTIKLIKKVDVYSRQSEDVISSYKSFFDRCPSAEKFDDAFSNHLLHHSTMELISTFTSKTSEYIDASDDVFYDALEEASLIDRKAVLSVTSTFKEIKTHFSSLRSTPLTGTLQKAFELYQENYESIKLINGLLRDLQNGLTDRLDEDLHDYYKEYKD